MDYNSNCFILYNYYYIDKNIIQFAPTIFYNPEYNYLYNIWTQKVTIPIYYNTNISNPYNVNNNINPSSINKIINDISSHNINPELYRGHPQGATCGTKSRPYNVNNKLLDKYHFINNKTESETESVLDYSYISSSTIISPSSKSPPSKPPPSIPLYNIPKKYLHKTLYKLDNTPPLPL